LGRQTGFLNELVVGRINDGLTFDLDKPQGSLAVSGFQGLLLAGSGALKVIPAVAPVEVEPLFHNDVFIKTREAALENTCLFQ
jgi:hypothetical protein